MSASGKISLSGLPRAELEALAERLLAENDALRQVVAGLKAEVATLKGVKGRPEVKPSGMEKGAGSEPGATNRGRGGRGKADRLPVHAERVGPAGVPAGSRFKGYEDFLVQDLVLRPHVVRLRRERWLTPDGRTVVAPMPAGITGHFGRAPPTPGPAPRPFRGGSGPVWGGPSPPGPRCRARPWGPTPAPSAP